MINYELLIIAFNMTLRRSNGKLKKKDEKRQKRSSIFLCSLEVMSYRPPIPLPLSPHPTAIPPTLCAICVDVEADSLFYS